MAWDALALLALLIPVALVLAVFSVSFTVLVRRETGGAATALQERDLNGFLGR